MGPKSASGRPCSRLPLWVGREGFKKTLLKGILGRPGRRKCTKTYRCLYISDENALARRTWFQAPWGPRNGPFRGPKWLPKRVPEGCGKRLRKWHPPKRPKWPPSRPQGPPSWPPNRPQVAPKGGASKLARTLPGPLWTFPFLPRTLPDPPGTAPRPFRDPSGTLPGALRDASGAPSGG